MDMYMTGLLFALWQTPAVIAVQSTGHAIRPHMPITCRIHSTSCSFTLQSSRGLLSSSHTATGPCGSQHTAVPKEMHNARVDLVVQKQCRAALFGARSSFKTPICVMQEHNICLHLMQGVWGANAGSTPTKTCTTGTTFSSHRPSSSKQH